MRRNPNHQVAQKARHRNAELLSRAQVREVDRAAIEDYGIPGIVLMENAARACAAEALALLPRRGAGVAVICGGGNNGGDGYAVARHLHIAGKTVEVFSIVDPEKLSGDAALNRAIVEKMGIEISDVLEPAHLCKTAVVKWRHADLLIDAILGTGFSGELRPHVAEAIKWLNAATERGKVLAIDVPSGLDCDTGVPSQPTVRADVTVTFVGKKIGFSKRAARKYLGRVVVAGIGAPREIAGRKIIKR